MSGAPARPAPRSPEPPPPDAATFFQAAAADEGLARPALERLAAHWRPGHAAALLDLARFMRAPGSPTEAPPEIFPGRPFAEEGEGSLGPTGSPRPGPRPAPGPVPRLDDPSARVRERLVRFLEKRTGRRFGHDLRAWRRWLWGLAYDPPPDYPAFKAVLYGAVDPKMAEFFRPGPPPLVRLDEVDWGGVTVNGIPPLDHPWVVPAGEARYLGERDVVFGVFLGGEARAYPKRILAWHELARDRLGGVELAVVYCTLCGTVVPYGTEAGGARRTFGTSGLLYRSNKLMFDEETMSLWSSVEGRPVVGPLAGSGLELVAHPVVTTTWREWRRAHPETTVLALETGFRRDYSEGAAYRDYFATDRLMFEVPRPDPRLRNKDEVLALLVEPAGGGAPRPLALAAKWLRERPVLGVSFAGRRLVVLTSRDGANRVYDAGEVRFPERPAGERLVDEDGRAWTLTEEALVSGDGRRLLRVAARRAFWFGWHAQHPGTELLDARRPEPLQAQ